MEYFLYAAIVLFLIWRAYHWLETTPTLTPDELLGLVDTEGQRALAQSSAKYDAYLERERKIRERLQRGKDACSTVLVEGLTSLQARRSEGTLNERDYLFPQIIADDAKLGGLGDDPI